MSKLTKLIKHPIKFFEDSAKKKKEISKLANVKNPVFAFRINDWKRPIIESWMPDKTFIYIPFKTSEALLEKKWLPLIEKTNNAEILVWGMNLPESIAKTTKPIKYVEDGFIRSVELGSKHAPPLSLNFDNKTPYFNSSKESDLEKLLSNYDFEENTELMVRAKENISKILESGISKYNNGKRCIAKDIYGEKTQKKRVLVIGQVEDDASILYGCSKQLNNNDVVQLAVRENPEAEVYYKPHPDVLHSNRKMLSNPDDVKNICKLILDNIAISDVLGTVDHVYTITSQVGFEALLRGIKVTTLGCPFYSGWGLTDDREICERRNRTLTVEQLFAGAYILYPQYFDPIDKSVCEIETVINHINLILNAADRQKIKKAPKIIKEPASVNTLGNKTDKKVAVKNNTVAKSQKTFSVVPTWYKPSIGQELNAKLDLYDTLYLYVPWVAEHTNALIDKIEKTGVPIAPLDFVNDLPSNRRNVGKFARENPILYRKMILRRLVQVKHKIKGVVLTFDWFPAMRLIAHCCKDLGIPVILIPHESVFADKKTYYYDVVAHASLPISDVVLGWGDLQKEIFVERGYPEDKIITVGAPKFDKHFNYEPKLKRDEFCKIYGLSNKKIILFATQPLDSQFDTSVALQAQRQAIWDLSDLCTKYDYQLLIRLPPAQHTIINAAMKRAIDSSDYMAIDDASCYLVDPEEAIFHCDIVASINSTMLFEALLLGRMPLSTKYVSFEQIWDNCKIPVAVDKQGIDAIIENYEQNGYTPDREGMAWAKKYLSVGHFDGKASERISHYLWEFMNSNNDPVKFDDNVSSIIINKKRIDIVGIPSTQAVLMGIQSYLSDMLLANKIVSTNKATEGISSLISVDCFAQWGITESKNKSEQRLAAKKLSRPLIFIEDGFLRSMAIGLSGEAGLSIILDDLTSYYDSTKPSRMEMLLEDGEELTSEELSRANAAINRIVSNKLSKYNHAPNIELSIGSNNKKVLLLDQRFGDQSVISGGGNEDSFHLMLQDAISNNPDADILIKQHPDAITGGKSSYFNNDKIAYTKHMSNVYLINYDINPHRLFDIVNEVYVVTSGMGFEALLAGKKVHCYGLPFYSGWGVTEDVQKIERRTRKRSVEEIFFVSYILLSRYYSPILNRQCSLEEVLDYFISNVKP
ncbi:capsular polysaccharide export protein, LipB/KpsS family [Halomonas sp. 86]|uniref:capsular polysaccharide export protein, LipB/KpsS family n=1 Tax=unclassified Halomonas TaxID=2609666 RepID=UPI004034B030